MSYISKITDLSGTTHDIKDAAVPEWAKAANPPSYELTYDPDCSVGSAEVGTAVTHDPNYTPSGDIHQTLEEVTFLTDASVSGELSASFSNGTLTLSLSGLSITPTTATKSVATSAPVFNGNGVHFVIEEES